MSIPIIGSVIEAGMKILDKLVPDKEERMKLQLELLRLQREGQFKELDTQLAMATAQTDINKVEAAHQSIFVSGWRPAMGWICGFIFFSNFIGVPLLAWLSPLLNLPPPPRLEIGEVLPVLMGMLGLGGLRTAEKIKSAT